MNGGRHREPITAEGCVSAIGWFFGLFFGMAILGVSLGWFFSAPPDVCMKYDAVKVIEKTQGKQEVLVERQVCTEYAPSPLPSPFWRVWERITP